MAAPSRGGNWSAEGADGHGEFYAPPSFLLSGLGSLFGRNQPLAPDSFTLALVHGGAVPTSPGALPLCPTSLAASLGHGEAPTAQGSKGCLFPGRAGIPRGLAGRSAMSTGQGDYAGQKPVGGGGGGNRRQLPLRRHKDLNPWQRRGEKPAPGQADPSDRSPCTPRQQEPQARSHHNRVSSGLASGGSGRRRPRQSAGGFPPPGQVSAVQPVSGGTEGSGRGGGTSHPPHPGSPHRLLWPKSKSFDYLYAVGEKLLQNFPVQATLCLYEDSGSEEDEEEEDEEEEAEAGAMPAGPPPHADSAVRPA